MKDDLIRIAEAIDCYAILNHRPVVDEPANDFERTVNEHAELVAAIAEIKGLLKPLETAERKLRDGLAESLKTWLGENLKEGVNTYELSNLVKLKFENKIDRKIEISEIENARSAYDAIAGGAGTLSFDELLNTKYELAKSQYNKIGDEAKHAVSRMIVSKPAAPVVRVD